MNPEKYQEHTALNHSLLWRKSYSFEKPFASQDSCHKQLNELGTSGQSWRTRNNMIQTNLSGFNKSQTSSLKKSSITKVDSILKDGRKQTDKTLDLKKSIVQNAQIVQRSARLIEGMQKLKELKLIQARDLQKVKFPGIIRHEHVYNDYHQRSTNAGFSRNFAGKFYTK